MYGKPTQEKNLLITNTQTVYTALINEYIELLSSDPVYYLDIFNNNKKSSNVRGLEKEVRKSNKDYSTLGSAFGQNAIDHAVKELHNHFTRIKNKLYGFCYHRQKELLPYLESIALLNVAIMDEDELKILNYLIEYELSKDKPKASTLSFYRELTEKINRFSQVQRKENREEIRMMFYEKLELWKKPFVRKASIQLDARVYKLEKSTNIKMPYVVSFKVFGEKDYVEIPLHTSKNSLRRLNQYKNGSPIVTIKNGLVKVAVPFDKKIKPFKTKKVFGIDVGITDLIYDSNRNSYGSFSGMTKIYEGTVEPKLKTRSSLRNKMKEYQKELRSKATSEGKKEFLRMKISNIACSLNGKKTLHKRKRKYAHEVDFRLNNAIKLFIDEAKIQRALVAMESLLITDFDRGKNANKRDSSWVRGKLTKRLQEKLTWNGIPFIEVDPAYTSKACSKCFNIHKANRKYKTFTCTVCKHTEDADYNASMNIKQRATDKEMIELVEKNKHSTKERHTAIKELYAKRHKKWLETSTVASV